MPKILIIPEFDAFGGTRTYFKLILEFYASQNYDVIIALSRRQLDDEVRLLAEKYRYKTCIIPERRTYLKRLWFRLPFSIFFDLYAVLPIIVKKKPDLVVVSNGTPGIFLGVMLLSVRCIYILHTYPTAKGKIPLTKTLLHAFLRKNKLLLTVSEFSKENIIRYWLSNKKTEFIKVLHNTVGTAAHEKAIRSGPHQTTRTVLTMGHVAWYKNPLQWINVAQKVIKKQRDMHVEFIWAGDGDLLDDCRKLAEKTGLESIKFIGYQKDVDALYAKCTVYFQPSLVENHSLSVVDAMRRGIPCVVSNSGGLPESVIDGVTGFVVKLNDADVMADKIIILLTNRDLSEKMGQIAQRHYNEKFSCDVWQRKMQALYDEILH